MKFLTRTVAVLAVILFSAAASAAPITSAQKAGEPLASGSVFGFSGTVGPNTAFVESIYFTTDATAALSSLSVLGLELVGVSGFVGDFTISLYEGILEAGDDTSSGVFLTSAVGTDLSNVSVDPNGEYSFVIEGLSGPGLANIYAGAVAVSEVPLPAAAWLFGSALLGLVAVSRRRNAYAKEPLR